MIAPGKRYALVLTAVVVCLAGLLPVTAQARDFEIPTFVFPGRNQDLTPSATAGAHPFELFNHFAVDRSPTPDELPGGGFEAPTENVKDLSFELPSGMVVGAASFPQCTQEAFSGGNCPASTQIGVANVSLADGQAVTTMPIFNMVAPPGIPAQFAYRLLLSSNRINFRVRSGGDYGLTASLSGISASFGLLTSSVSIWGVPGDPGHDSLRFTGNGSPDPGPYPEPAPFRALVSNPTSCDGPLATTMEATTWQNPDQITSAAAFEAPAMTGCGQIDFNPSIEAKTTTNLADSPTGLDVHVQVPQNKDAEGIAAAHLRQVKFMLPPGLTVNPSAANGLGSCTAGQIGFTELSNERQLIRYDLPPVKFSGSFVVSFKGQSTTPIAATASRSEVAQALEAIPGLAGNVSVRGSQGGWIVELTGALGGTNVPLMSGTVTDNPSQKVTVTGEGGTFTLSFGGGTTTELPFDASAAEVQAALREIPAIALDNLYPGNVFVSIGKVEAAKRFYEVIFAEDLAGPQTTMSATSSLTGPGAGVGVVPVPPPPSHELSVATLGGVAPGTARFTEGAGSCPDSSKIGIARIDAPAVVGHPLEGVVYLATPQQNPFGSLLAFYISVNDPQSGVVTKLPALIEPDSQTGQLKMTVSEMPQLPFEDIDFEFFKGSTAPFKTGVACGTFRVNADLTPWTAPASVVVHSNDSFTIEKGAGAGECVKDELSAPNDPTFEAGTFEPTGGVYSPVTFKLSRPDGSQQLSTMDATLPKGLSANLAGIPYCSDAALAAVAGRSGREEQASPSCPAASRVGTVNIGAGAGPTPYHLPGDVFLAGAYKGAPLSLAAVVPAVAGPFDLGDVLVRIALHLDPEAAQIRAVSDPLPAILKGIPLSIRSVVLNLDRNQFTLNPTNCGSTAINGSLTALTGQGTGLNEHFQVGECARLGFKPKLGLRLKGSTKRRRNPSLIANFTPRPGDANLGQAIISLPKTALLDNAHIKGVCTRAEFAASNCPANSVYGSAKAVTPLLDGPIEGPVYLRSSDSSLPDLVADLRGQINFVIGARVDATRGGGIRASFENVPDIPLAQFSLTLSGGKTGLIENGRNVCARANKAAVLLGGQNGKTINVNPVLANGCKKARKGAKHKGAKHKGAKRKDKAGK
jgi:hypothetical protein